MTGTVRWQLTVLERSIWADLLCLAGMSRFPGVIASGYEGDENSPLMGYPMGWLASQCRADVAQMDSALRKLQAQERLTVKESGLSEDGQTLVLVTILNWDKYQSEYQLKRQRRHYNEPARSDSEYVHSNVHTKSPKCPPEEVDGEKKESGSISKTEIEPQLTSFAEWWGLYPKKLSRKKAERAWNRLSISNRKLAFDGLEAWKQTEQWQKDGGQYIPYAEKFLNQELYTERAPSTAVAADPFNPEALKKERAKHEDLMRRIAEDEPKPVGGSIRKKT